MAETRPKFGRWDASLVPSAFLLVSFSYFALAGDAVLASPFSYIRGTNETLSPASVAAARKAETIGLASPDGKTLTFGQNTIRLVAVTGPDSDMLSYRIAGRRNPTLVVTRGATIQLLFVNTDDDMTHDVRFGAPLKSYPSVMTAYRTVSVGTPELAHKSVTALHGEVLTLHAPAVPGTYVYLCTVRGHAQGGMVGKVVVR